MKNQLSKLRPIDEPFSVADYIQQNFYKRISPQGREQIMFRFDNGDFTSYDEVSASVLEQAAREYAKEQGLQIEVNPQDFLIEATGSDYVPHAGLLIRAKNAPIYKVNKWRPPSYLPRREPHSPVRPPVWDEYLNNLMPPEHLCTLGQVDMPQQNYFEMWLANRVCAPRNAPTVAILLRGEQGTGKGFAYDNVVSPIIGKSNYVSTDFGDFTKSGFNADVFESTLLNFEEVKDTTVKTANKMKQFSTQEWQRVNEKFVQQRTAKRYFAYTMSSNFQVPMRLEATDRRHFVPAFSMHHPNHPNAAKEFFRRFANWLENGDGLPGDGSPNGLQIMCEYFHDLYFHGLPLIGAGKDWDWMEAPHTKEKDELRVKSDPSEARQDQIALVLSPLLDALVFETVSVMNDFPGASDVDVQRVFSTLGLVSHQLRIEGRKPWLWLKPEYRDRATGKKGKQVSLTQQGLKLYQGSRRDSVVIRANGDPTEDELKRRFNQ